MDMNATMIAVAGLFGAICAGVASLATLYFTKGIPAQSKAQVDLLKAQAAIKQMDQDGVIKQKDFEITQLNRIIETLRDTAKSERSRIETLEANYENLRQLGHDRNDAYHVEALKCAKENAEMRGELNVTKLLMGQIMDLLKPKIQAGLESTIPKVEVANTNPIPVTNTK